MIKNRKKRLKKARRPKNQPEEKPLDTYFPGSKQLIQEAFGAARKVDRPKRRTTPKDKLKKIERALKAKAFGSFLQEKLLEISKQLPKIDEMNPFYLDL